MSHIAPIRRLQDEAYDYLKEKILAGELVEGELYSESQLTQTLNMSRTPVRDALLRLNMEGLLEIYPSRGFMIRNVGMAEIKETLEIRCALEGYAAYVLAERNETREAREIVRRLNENIDIHEQMLLNREVDIRKFAEHNIIFHNIMIDYLHNDTISQTYKKFENKIREMTQQRWEKDRNMMPLVIKAHIQIVALIRSGNKEQAYTRIKLHNDRDYYLGEQACNMQ